MLNEQKHKKERLVSRIINYYRENLDDGEGGKLSLQNLAEFAPEVACVQDSLGEFDIFYDTEEWKLIDSAPEPYNRFLGLVKESFSKTFADKYGMAAISEWRWFPLHKRKRASFFEAREAARNYLQSTKGFEFYLGPKLINLEK